MESTLHTNGMPNIAPIRQKDIVSIPTKSSDQRSGASPIETWALPPVGAVLITAGILICWSLIDAESVSRLAILCGLACIGAIAWAARTWLVRSNRDISELALDCLASAGTIAIGTGAIASGTTLSPFLLLLPVIGVVASLTYRWDLLPDVVLLIALASIAGTGIHAIVFNEAPFTDTAFYLGTIGAFGAAGLIVGERVRDSGMTISRRQRRSKARSAGLQAERFEHMLDADSPLAAARVAADILESEIRPTYLAIAEFIPDTTMLRPIVERGALNIDADKIRTRLASLSQEAVADGRPRQIFDDGSNLDALVCRRLGVKALVIVPLRRLGTTLGMIHIAWETIDDVQRLDDARRIAADLSPWISPDLAISRVAGEIERGYVTAMAAVSASFDERDEHSSGHSRRVAKVALEIAEVLRLSEHDQRQLLYAAEVHDLGRVGISEGILAKQDALTDEEWTQVKRIPVIGADIVGPVSFFGDIREAVLYLRERWDGEGYPTGRHGNDIPLLARILAIAEAYDAMTSHRPYRDAMTSTEALRQLWSERGKTFDPEIVETFVMHRAPRPVVSA